MSQLSLKHNIITQKFMWRKFMWGQVGSYGPPDSMNKGHILTLYSDTFCRSSDFELLFWRSCKKSHWPKWGQMKVIWGQVIFTFSTIQVINRKRTEIPIVTFFVRFIVQPPFFQERTYLPYNNSPGLIELCHVTWRWHLFKLSHDRKITWHTGQKFNSFHSHSYLKFRSR